MTSGELLGRASSCSGEILWPLALGFGLSGAVQAFVSRGTMQAKIGDHRPASVARATGYGAVSSSCSYAASSMAKSLFTKGADFVAALVFMFASTNLVIELGIVLVVLMGWQFAVSEFVGGAIMIALLAVLVLWLRGRLVVEARVRLSGGSVHGHDSGHDHQAGHDHEPGRHGSPEGEPQRHEPWVKRLRSKSGWADASTYTIADLTMLRKELVIGYGVAGFLAVSVPVTCGTRSFSTGTGSGRTSRTSWWAR